MTAKHPNPERLILFSDAVFAIIITLLVLELRPPHSASWQALGSLWPSALSYAVSYLFLAIVWTNHHHVLRFAPTASPRLIWGNFAHLFSVSLMPFATAWIADSRLGAVPVAFYAGVFVLVNATYMILCAEAVDRQDTSIIPLQVCRTMRLRSFLTLALFASAGCVALFQPIVGLVMICACLLLYLRPDTFKLNFAKRRPTPTA
ncbi:TMEM175 family protein [Pinirhizobacter soli]|uniref:TMEM175 family protein n=1 Tax=Pinirhizobacter soli TaxID=2786953 RepID=UPI00202A1E9C|nr:TMEM175 family protein [Pinirhizobacter soli]